MNRIRIAALVAVVVATLLAAGADPTAGATAAGQASALPALERFKALAGDWVAAEDGEMVKKGDLVARYAVTAAGSAVVETVFPGSPHEMVTVYHADGGDLVLTHYCMAGNQPRMRAKSPTGSRVELAFDGATNIDPARDRHMHSAWVDFVGPNEIRSEWTEHSAGQTALVVKMHLVRKTSQGGVGR